MISRAFKFTLLGLPVVAGLVGIVLLRKDSDRLHQRLATEHRLQQQSQAMRQEIRRTQTLVARMQESETDGARAIHADLLRARDEVAALEKRARLTRAQRLSQSAADAEALDRNRDPEKNLVRLEYFQNAGQATPGAALQTLVWAAMKGDEAALARVVALTDPARAKAQALIAKLPEHDRAQWSPERVGGMFVSALLTEVPALQILGATLENDGQKATLDLRVPQPSNRDGTQHIPMQRFADGWKVLVSEGQIERVRKKVEGSD